MSDRVVYSIPCARVTSWLNAVDLLHGHYRLAGRRNGVAVIGACQHGEVGVGDDRSPGHSIVEVTSGDRHDGRKRICRFRHGNIRPGDIPSHAETGHIDPAGIDPEMGDRILDLRIHDVVIRPRIDELGSKNDELEAAAIDFEAVRPGAICDQFKRGIMQHHGQVRRVAFA